MKGWAVFKDGKPMPGVYQTKKSLLISYDMIPLRGLEKTERRLIEVGMPPVKVQVVPVETDGDFYCFTLRGRLLPEALDYTTLKGTLSDAKYSAAGFFVSEMRSAQRYSGEFSEAERLILSKYYNWSIYGLCKDKRRKSTWAELCHQLDGLFDKHGIKIVPVRILEMSITLTP